MSHWVEPDTGEIVSRQIKRAAFLENFANRAPCLIGTEACGGAQHWARRLIEIGHLVKLMPGKFKAFNIGDKNDAADAHAIWMTVQQPSKAVAVEIEAQQAVLALHRVRQQLVECRTMQINRLRGLLTEYGEVMGTVKSADPIKVITVRSTGFDAVATEGGNATVDKIEAAAGSGISSFVSREVTKLDCPELTSANIIVSSGRGPGSSENYTQVPESLADELGAAMGVSRAAVDAGYVPNDYQVDQTGKIVAPHLHVAVSISGAIRHLAGMKDSKLIVAINKDPEEPIFSVADYGLAGDLFAVVPDLVESV
jgi:electron transfer flavoprotein alpha subunit